MQEKRGLLGSASPPDGSAKGERTGRWKRSETVAEQCSLLAAQSFGADIVTIQDGSCKDT